MNGLKVEGMAQHKGDIFLSTQVRYPVPGEGGFDSHADVISIRGNGFNKRFFGCFDIAMSEDFTIVVNDID